MKIFKSSLVACSFFLMACSQSPNNTLALHDASDAQSFYDFKTTGLTGAPFDFSTLKGKRVLIVNTASKCGYTPQYKELQELYNKFGGAKFEIIGFPANNFGFQEPGSNEKIADFCEKNYGVTFPMMEKVSVKGKDMHPVYQWLTQQSHNGISDASVKWNFHKFLVDENGKWVASLGSSVSPLDETIITFASGK